jgi:hypothetical protein
MYSNGITEMLMLDQEDLEILRDNYHNLHVDYLKSIDIFKTYPFVNLQSRSGAISYKYFGYFRHIFV